MRIYLDLDTRKLMSSPIRALSKLEFKRRDNDTIELQFLRDGTVQELPSGTSARLGIKINADYASEFLALTTLTKSGTGTATVYGGRLNLNTDAIATVFASEPVTFDGMLEVEWTTGVAVSSSQTLPVTLFNDVIRGDEGEPATLPVFYTSETSNFKATQAQAEAGTDNGTWMTPLRTAQAIAANGAGPHTHPLSDLRQSGATVGQVPRWDGTTWTPATPSTGGGGSGGGVTSYLDLTDKPTLGTAAATDASAYATAAQGAKADSASQPGHTHSAADILSGTLSIARIPTGTTSTTVAFGNHTHAATDIIGTLDIASIPTGTTSTTVALGSHTHGNLTSAGSIGSTSGVPIITGPSGKLQAGSFGTTAGTFCQGNDSRLINLSGGITAIAVVATMPTTPSATTLYIVTT